MANVKVKILQKMEQMCIESHNKQNKYQLSLQFGENGHLMAMNRFSKIIIDAVAAKL